MTDRRLQGKEIRKERKSKTEKIICWQDRQHNRGNCESIENIYY